MRHHHSSVISDESDDKHLQQHTTVGVYVPSCIHTQTGRKQELADDLKEQLSTPQHEEKFVADCTN